MDNVISLKNVTKRYGNKTVLDNVNFSVDAGKIYGLIGPSGAGKTTMVKLIMGSETATAGEVTVLDTKMPDVKLLQKLGYMAQEDAVYPELNGGENLKFFASLFGIKGQKCKERIEYVANLVNLSNELKKRTSAYSGGMKRRLSLAISLIQDPEILVLDEPTVGIDPELRMSIWEELNRLKTEQAKTILVTTHVMDEAEKCDYLTMVRDGKILASGTPNELLERYNVNKLEDVFLKAGGSGS